VHSALAPYGHLQTTAAAANDFPYDQVSLEIPRRDLREDDLTNLSLDPPSRLRGGRK
jgi:hypothetical protein